MMICSAGIAILPILRPKLRPNFRQYSLALGRRQLAGVGLGTALDRKQLRSPVGVRSDDIARVTFDHQYPYCGLAASTDHVFVLKWRHDRHDSSAVAL